MADGYRGAAICERGHVAKSYLQPGQAIPDNFCETCGAPILRGCPACATALRGEYHVDGVISFSSHYAAPAHCFACGARMPWTQTALDAIAELAREDTDLSEEDQALLVQAVERLGDEAPSPETTLAISRFRRLVGRAGQTTGAAITNIATQVASAYVKQQLGL